MGGPPEIEKAAPQEVICNLPIEGAPNEQGDGPGGFEPGGREGCATRSAPGCFGGDPKTGRGMGSGASPAAPEAAAAAR